MEKRDELGGRRCHAEAPQPGPSEGTDKLGELLGRFRQAKLDPLTASTRSQTDDRGTEYGPLDVPKTDDVDPRRYGCGNRMFHLCGCLGELLVAASAPAEEHGERGSFVLHELEERQQPAFDLVPRPTSDRGRLF